MSSSKRSCGSAPPARHLRPASRTCFSFRRIWSVICLPRRRAEGMQVTEDGQLQTSASTSRLGLPGHRDGRAVAGPGGRGAAPGDALHVPLPSWVQPGYAWTTDIVECLLLDTPETTAADPTSIELARFSRASADPNRRTAIVSSGEPCLVASPVVGLAAGCAVQTTRGVPHLSLSQHLAKAGQQYENRLTVAGRCPQGDCPAGHRAAAPARTFRAARRGRRPDADGGRRSRRSRS